MTNAAVKKLYSGNVGIEYGQFYIDVPEADDEDEYLDPDAAFERQANGICGGAQTGKVFFVAGIQNGTIDLGVELHSSEPPLDQSYEEVVEVSFERGESPVSLCEWACESAYDLELEQGSYRIRYHIIGMDKDYDDDDDGESVVPGQRYLIQIWRAPVETDAIIKQTSESAAYWHGEWGGGA
ncbi:hypothetical protein [Halopseudomonas salegens]|nr:hypothetical protein [Halopseudomonas salegens]